MLLPPGENFPCGHLMQTVGSFGIDAPPVERDPAGHCCRAHWKAPPVE
jgi:hypothetical protein